MLRQLPWVLAVAALCAGCPRAAPGPAAAAAAPEPYGIEVERGAGGDAVRAELVARAGDDVVGDGGHVLRLTGGERARMAAAAGVIAVRPLTAEERRAPGLVERAAAADGAALDVRVDLFVDASAAEAEAVAGWIAASNGAVRWRGPRALTAAVPAAAIEGLARLSPVRWVE
jgi:hypothetical protein